MNTSSSRKSGVRNLIATGLKLAVSAALLAFLVLQARHNNNFTALRDGPKHWGFLLAACGCVLAAVLLTLVRWYFLVVTLGLRFSLRDALRLGFLGYLFNFLALGSVGGDLFKAVFLAREQPGKRTEAVASVVTDRVIGLYSLFVLASVAVLCTGSYRAGSPGSLQALSFGTIAATVLGGVAIWLAAAVGGACHRVLARGPAPHWLRDISLRMVDALAIYRRRFSVILLAVALSLGVHSLLATGIYLVALGLPGPTPAWGTHYLIVPLASVAGALPLPLAGLGAYETALEFLYRWSLADSASAIGRGLVLALAYRLNTVVVAAIGGVVYAVSRREVADVMQEESLC